MNRFSKVIQSKHVYALFGPAVYIYANAYTLKCAQSKFLNDKYQTEIINDVFAGRIRTMESVKLDRETNNIREGRPVNREFIVEDYREMVEFHCDMNRITRNSESFHSQLDDKSAQLREYIVINNLDKPLA